MNQLSVDSEKLSFDSLRVRVPLSKCEWVSHRIQDIIERVSIISGEVYESETKNKERFEQNGISTKVSIESEFNGVSYLPYVVILVNAKMLKTQYLHGINGDNVKDIYSFIQDLNLVKFSFDTFIDSECTDMDVKMDLVSTDSNMKEVFDVMLKNAKPCIDFDKGVKRFWEKENKGIQFNKRQTTKYKTAPFVKIYSKTLDLKTKSNKFALEYLNEIPKDLWRMEYNIKNKKHLKLLFGMNQGNKLKDILELSQENLSQAMQTTLKAVLSKRVNEIILNDNIPPKDLILVNALIMHLDNGFTWEPLKRGLLGSLSGSNRTKKAVQLDTLFNSYIKPIERYSNQKNVDSVLAKIGYTF
jgi:hypothetical protein